MQYEILDHPADIGIKVYGKSLEELFINAAMGTSALIVEPFETSEKSIRKEVNLNTKNYTELFTNWLDEIIYLFDTNGFLTKRIKNISIHSSKEECNIQALLEGEKFNKNKHEIKLYLKAVTYHQLQIKQLKDKSWEAIVYFDI